MNVFKYIPPINNKFVIRIKVKKILTVMKIYVILTDYVNFYN